MEKSQIFPLNTAFKPSPALTTWFIIDFIIVIVLILACTIIPLMIPSEPDWIIVGISLAGVFIFAVIFVAWVRLYYVSMWYELRDDEMSWRSHSCNRTSRPENNRRTGKNPFIA